MSHNEQGNPSGPGPENRTAAAIFSDPGQLERRLLFLELETKPGMSVMEMVTRDGTAFVPAYLDSIDAADCLGCGRCFKVCGQGVLKPMGIDEDGAMVEDVDDGDVERTVMTVADGGKCIGCGSCGRVCTRKCQKRAA